MTNKKMDLNSRESERDEPQKLDRLKVGKVFRIN
jgi:hypothetical protein